MLLLINDLRTIFALPKCVTPGFCPVILLIVCSLFFVPPFTPAQTGGSGGDAVAVFNQAQDLHEKGDLAGAVALYEKALTIEPAFPEAEYQRGVAQLALGKTAEAERSFRRAAELRPDWTLALTSLGSLLVQTGQNAEAETILAKTIELEPQNSSALAAMVELRLKTKSSPAVLNELLAKVISLTSKANPTAAIWNARAALEFELGKREAAQLSLEDALRIDPRHVSSLYLAANIALSGGDVVRAKEIARKLDAVSPRAESLTLLKANIFMADGNYEGAAGLLENISASLPQAAELRARIAANRAAIPAELEKQLEADPKNAVALGRLCSLLRRDDPSKALDYCRRASAAEPANINHAIGYGAALVQAKQFDAAATLLRKLLENAPDNASVHANLATALFELKRYAEAQTEYVWLTTRQPDLPAAYFFLAITFDQTGQYLDAMANYQHFLRIADPVQSKLEIERVNLRLPWLQEQIKSKGKNKK